MLYVTLILKKVFRIFFSLKSKTSEIFEYQFQFISLTVGSVFVRI